MSHACLPQAVRRCPSAPSCFCSVTQAALPRPSLLQKSPILTPAELEQQRAEAERRLEEELAAAKVARAARAEAATDAELAAAAQPKTEMERQRERERREVIARAQLSLLVGGKGLRRRWTRESGGHSQCCAAQTRCRWDHRQDTDNH